MMRRFRVVETDGDDGGGWGRGVWVKERKRGLATVHMLDAGIPPCFPAYVTCLPTPERVLRGKDGIEIPLSVEDHVEQDRDRNCIALLLHRSTPMNTNFY